MRREQDQLLATRDPFIPGTKLVCVDHSDELEQEWGWAYPKVGEVVTVWHSELHTEPECAASGIYLLHLYRYEHIFTGICDRTIDGTFNFLPFTDNQS